MADAPRQLWLGALKDELAAIDGSGSLKSTVVKVERVVRAPEEVPQDQRPWIGIQTGSGVPVYDSSGRIRIVETVTLFCYVPGQNDVEIANNLDNLLDDLFAILVGPFGDGDAATDVKIAEYATDESDASKDGRGGIMAVTLAVTYHRGAESS